MAARAHGLEARIIKYLAAGFVSRRGLCIYLGAKASEIDAALEAAVESGEVVKETQISESNQRRQVAGFRLASSVGSGAGKRKVRKCMCCRSEFFSAGPMNRLCNRCRTQDISPYAP